MWDKGGEAQLVPGFHELVDQGGRGEAHRQSPLAGGQSQSQGDVGLADAAVADGDDVAHYLAARAGSGTSIATIRLATSAITKAHEWTGHESPHKDRGVRASLKGWGRRLAKPLRQAGALTAVQPRLRGRGFETPEQAEERGKFDLALVAVLSDAGLRRSEASSLTWGDVQCWDDGSGRITVIRSKTDVEAQGAVVATSARRHGSPGRHPAGGRWWR